MGWGWFAALVLAPDLSMLGYLAGPRVGAACYNAAHTYAGPALLAGLLPALWGLPLVWTAHVGGGPHARLRAEASDRIPRHALRAGVRRVGIGPSVDAWGKRGRFQYAGSVEEGTRIVYGRGKSFTVSAATYADLLAHFRGRTVPIGNSRRPPRGSLGSWLQTHVGGENLAAYVGPILVQAGVAARDGDALRFTS